MGQKIIPGKEMKTLKIKIIKESKINETLPAVEKELPDAAKATLLVVAGDSIAVGLSYNALGLVGVKKVSKRHIDSIPGFDAILGGQRASWVDKNLNLDSYSSHSGKKILIVIAGTNDALNWSIGGNIKASAAAASVGSIVSKAKRAGFDATVMKLHAYTGKRKDVDSEKHQAFVREFNSAVGSYKTFDMVTPTSDGVHAPFNARANTELLNRALKSLSTKIEDISLPSAVSYRTGKKRPQIQTQTVDSGIKKDKAGCYESPTCNCVTSEVLQTSSLSSLQSALQAIAKARKESDPLPEHSADGRCGSETKAAISSFQRQYNSTIENGDEKIKCDSCIGPVTYDKIINTMKNLKIKMDLKTHEPSKRKRKITISTKTTKLKEPGAIPNTDTTRAYGKETVTIAGKRQRKAKIWPSYKIETLYKISSQWAPNDASEDDKKIMAAVGMAESGGIPSVLFKSSKHRDLSFGIWQINMLKKTGLGAYRRKLYGLENNNQLYHPNLNCQIAWDLWRRKKRRGKSGLNAFSDWSVTYRNKSDGRGYKRFLSALAELDKNLAQRYK